MSTYFMQYTYHLIQQMCNYGLYSTGLHLLNYVQHDKDSGLNFFIQVQPMVLFLGFRSSIIGFRLWFIWAGPRPIDSTTSDDDKALSCS